jgi:endonuclease YncB( thermonuclease family)
MSNQILVMLKKPPFVFLFLICAALLAAHASAAEFEKLDRCTFLPNMADDGDSFHVKWRGKEFIFRLYFVDTPETESRFPERVEEQAKYFGITTDEALRIGKTAAEFTRRTLGSKNFTVYTRWQDARGESRLPRYYAFVLVEEKQQLAELLVENGLARVFGMPAKLPTGMNANTFEAHLRVVEAKAKQDHLGAWGVHAPVKATQPASSWDKMFPSKQAASPQPAGTR